MSQQVFDLYYVWHNTTPGIWLPMVLISSLLMMDKVHKREERKENWSRINVHGPLDVLYPSILQKEKRDTKCFSQLVLRYMHHTHIPNPTHTIQYWPPAFMLRVMDDWRLQASWKTKQNESAHIVTKVNALQPYYLLVMLVFLNIQLITKATYIIWSELTQCGVAWASVSV